MRFFSLEKSTLMSNLEALPEWTHLLLLHDVLFSIYKSLIYLFPILFLLIFLLLSIGTFQSLSLAYEI